MAPPQKETLRPVRAEEQAALERISRASSERVDRVRRATALLAVARGQSLVRAAEQAGLKSGSTVAELVGRFNVRGMAALGIAAGRGRKPQYDRAARARIVTTRLRRAA